MEVKKKNEKSKIFWEKEFLKKMLVGVVELAIVKSLIRDDQF